MYSDAHQIYNGGYTVEEIWELRQNTFLLLYLNIAYYFYNEHVLLLSFL